MLDEIGSQCFEINYRSVHQVHTIALLLLGFISDVQDFCFGAAVFVGVGNLDTSVLFVGLDLILGVFWP